MTIIVRKTMKSMMTISLTPSTATRNTARTSIVITRMRTMIMATKIMMNTAPTTSTTPAQNTDMKSIARAVTTVIMVGMEVTKKLLLRH